MIVVEVNLFLNIYNYLFFDIAFLNILFIKVN